MVWEHAGKSEPVNIEFVSAPDMPALAYLFPGQGSQHVGMGHNLYQASAVARDTLDAADDILGFALSQLCFQGPQTALTDTMSAQPALLTVSVAALRTAAQLLGQLPLPVALAGHSLGEYTALVAAGTLSFADGLHLVRERGRLMRAMGAKCPGRMAAVLGMTYEDLEVLCHDVVQDTGEVVQIANANSPTQQVISGTVAGVTAVTQLAPAQGARRVLPLEVSIPAHSPLMAGAKPALGQAIQAASFHAPQAPVVCNTTAQATTDPAVLRQELQDQLDGSVLWHASMKTLKSMGSTAFVEFGSGKVLGNLARHFDRRLPSFSLQDMESITRWTDWLAQQST